MRRCFLTGLLLLSATLSGWSQQVDMLDVNSYVTPSVAFSQTYSESVVNDPDNGPSDVGTGTFTGKIVASLHDVDQTTIDENTQIGCSFGSFTDSHALGDDPNYKPGATTVSYVLPGPPSDPNDPNSLPTVGGTVTYTWTATSLTVVAVGNVLDVGSPVDATTYNDGPIQDTTDASVTFGDASGYHDMLVSGTHHTTAQTVGTGDNAQEFDLQSATISGAGDYYGPKLSFASAPPARTQNSQLSLIVKSNGVDVQLSENDGDFMSLTADASGVQWPVTVDLQPGPNHLEFSADDGDSGLSALGADVFYTVPATIDIEVSGTGTVTSALQGHTTHSVGDVLTVVATPGPGQVFNGWSGDLTSSDASLTFTVTDGLSLVASFVPTPFTAVAGTYNVYFNGSEDDTPLNGSLRLSMAGNGSFTGQVIVDGSPYALTGQFLPDGTAQVQVTTDAAHKDLTLALAFDLSQATPTLTGSIAYTGSEDPAVSFTDDAPVFTPNTSLQGLYNVVLHTPDGATLGFASIYVTSGGTAVVAGKLRDHATILTLSGGGAIGSDSTLTVNQSFYVKSKVKSASLSGQIQFGSDLTCSGTLAWQLTTKTSSKHSTTTGTQVQITGGAYTAPTSAPPLFHVETASDDGRHFVLTKDVPVNGRAGGVVVHFNLANGYISGGFNHPGVGARATFSGVWDPSAGDGAGFYTAVRTAPPEKDFGSVQLSEPDGQ